MPTPMQIKSDVVNELRNKIYYSQLEIQRLINNPAGLTHREIVDKITSELRENMIAAYSIEILESYLPTPQPKTAPAPTQDGMKSPVE